MLARLDHPLSPRAKPKEIAMTELEPIYDVTEQNFAERVMEASQQRPILLDFWADWCAPCKSLMPLLEKLATEYAGAFALAKINIDQNQQLAMQLQIRSVPTVKLVYQGAIVDEFTGALPESQLREFLDRHLPNEGNELQQAVEAALQQGDVDQALQLVEQAIELQPEDQGLLISKLEILAGHDRIDQARELLEALPDTVALDPRIDSIRAAINLSSAATGTEDETALMLRLEQASDDHEARYQLAMLLASRGEHRGALDHLLQILKRQQGFNEGAAQRAMLDIFNLLGSDDPLVSEYRRAMANLLY